MWFPKYKWTDKSKGILQVSLTEGHEYEVRLGEFNIRYFNTRGCKCKPEIILELNLVRINAESCPIHIIGGNDRLLFKFYDTMEEIYEEE